MIKKPKKQLLVGIVVGIAVTVLAVGGTYYFWEKSLWLPASEIESKAAKFINEDLLEGQGTAAVKVSGREGDMYKLDVDYDGQKVSSYVSKDGRKLYLQAYDLEKNKDAKSRSASAVDEVAQKSDKPIVELFVMSYCPYGLQMEKVILPAVKTLGDKIDFKIKFTDYAMHGEKELKEQLNQYCIQKEEPAKYLTYLECFLKDGENGGEGCISQTGVDKVKLEKCVAETDQEYKVMENFNNKKGFKGNYPGFEVSKSDNEKYGVEGSPTLVINGAKNESARDGKSLLKSICSAFNNSPQECSTELSEDAPSPGFGSGAASSGSSEGSCG